MATRDHITGKQSRRELLRRAGGATLTIAAAGIPTAATATTAAAVAAAPDNPDAALLAQAEQFWREHWKYAALKRRSARLRARAARDLGCPAWANPTRDPTVHAAWKAWHAAFQRVKERAAAIFALPARTPAGVLVKLRIFAAAYGIDELERADGDVGDEDLYAVSEGWLASAVHDLAAIVEPGGAGTAA